MEDSPCADCFRALLRPRAEDPLKATKKDDDLWGGMERGGAWGVMHPPSLHEMHPPLAAFAAPLPYSPTGAQYAPAQYHHAQHFSPGQNMVPSSNYYGVYVHQGYHRHRGGSTHEPGGAGAVPPQHYSTGFQPHSQAHFYPHPHHRVAGGGAQYSPHGGHPSPYGGGGGGGGGQVSHPRSPKAPKPATPSEPEQAWPRLPRVESPPVPLQQVEQHGNEPHLAPAHLGPRTSSGLQSMMGSTSTKMDFDDEPHVGAADPATPTPADSGTERDPKGEYEGDLGAKPGSFGEALFAWGPPQPSRLQSRQASPLPTPMETPVLPNATDLGGLLSATWVEVPYDELQLLDVIGEGAFGKVHKAKWRGATVAVKALSTDGNGGAMRGTPLEEFQKELVTMAAVPDHPHVLGLLGASTVPPQFAIVTPYCARGSLYALLHSPADFLTWTQIVHVALGAARGMLHLHTHGILHRDLKSANLLCDSNLDVKVADFGLSRNISENTMTGGLGTFQWMAPEVLSHQRYSERADVYSFAIVLWECVARKLPYADMNGWQAAMAVMTRGLRPTMPPGTPTPLTALIQACWAAVPTDRPLFPHIVKQLERFLDQLEGRATRPHQPLPSAV